MTDDDFVHLAEAAAQIIYRDSGSVNYYSWSREMKIAFGQFLVQWVRRHD